LREIIKARPLSIIEGWLVCEFDNDEKAPGRYEALHERDTCQIAEP